LEKALDEERRKVKPKLPVLPIPIPDFLDMEAYLLEIEDRAEALLDQIRSMGGGFLSLYDLTADKSWVEVVRVFMMLLFLAQQDEIDLHQDEDETDIIVRVKESVEDE